MRHVGLTQGDCRVRRLIPTLKLALCGAALLINACSAGSGGPSGVQGSGVTADKPGAGSSDDGQGAILGDDAQGLPTVCGDGILAEGEYCDDGNTTPGDGCNESCQIEQGWVCPDGKCEFSNYCGDGRVTPPELCDDGNVVAGDGCGFDCRVEPDWVRPYPGQPCQFNAVCGDGLRASLEECDDGNTNPGDGCSATCTAEPGFLCGDGVVAGSEDCDDGNAAAGDGCSAVCKLEPPLWDATTNSMIGSWTSPGSPCTSVCGDGVVEGEPCDDGNNNDMGDGCSPGCRLEPDCTAPDGTCVVAVRRRADPGRRQRGVRRRQQPLGRRLQRDCKIEPGFDCPPWSTTAGATLHAAHRVSRLLRRRLDGAPAGTPPYYNTDGHPDFENETFSRNTPKVTVTSQRGQTFTDIAGPTRGMVNAQLGAGQTGPVPSSLCLPAHGHAGADHVSAATFHQWYVDTPGTNVTFGRQPVCSRRWRRRLVRVRHRRVLPARLRPHGRDAAAPGPEPMRALRTGSATAAASGSPMGSGPTSPTAPGHGRPCADAQLQLHQRGALLVRVPGRRAAGRSAATTTSGCSSRAAGRRSWAATTSRTAATCAATSGAASEAQPTCGA